MRNQENGALIQNPGNPTVYKDEKSESDIYSVKFHPKEVCLTFS